jgi:hypothetical protein
MNLQKNEIFRSIQTDFEDAFESLASKYCLDGFEEIDAVQKTAERFSRLIKTAESPEYDRDGYIAPMQACTDAEVVRWFGGNENRERLIGRIRDWIGLARAVKARRLLLDGSFVTAKENPNDVDAVVLLPEDFSQKLEAGHSDARKLAEMFISREPKELFAAEDEEDWWRWFEFFSRTREKTGRRKGLVEVLL